MHGDDGAVYHFFGRHEAERIRKRVEDWLEKIEDIVVVCTHDDGTVLSTYRNQRFPRYTRRFPQYTAKKADRGERLK